MQIATATLKLGGDDGNTIQKFNITPSEVAVLRVIHGDDAVMDIEPIGNVTRTNRAERERLTQTYGRNQPNGTFDAPAVNHLFPGVAARMFDSFDELELDEYFFKVETRAASRAPTSAEPVVIAGEAKPLSAMTKGELLDLAAKRGVEVAESNKKAEIVAAIEAAEELADDGIDDINDGHARKAEPGENLFA